MAAVPTKAGLPPAKSGTKPARRAPYMSAPVYGPALETLKKRGEFTRLRGGVRWSGAAFVLEGKPRPAGQPNGVRFGFTITKKIGKAHERNRMRRRLSHALRSVVHPPELAGWDCVIVARRAALDVAFSDLVRDFEVALKRLARPAQLQTAKPRQDSTSP